MKTSKLQIYITYTVVNEELHVSSAISYQKVYSDNNRIFKIAYALILPKPCSYIIYDDEDCVSTVCMRYNNKVM